MSGGYFFGIFMLEIHSRCNVLYKKLWVGEYFSKIFMLEVFQIYLKYLNFEIYSMCMCNMLCRKLLVG